MESEGKEEPRVVLNSQGSRAGPHGSIRYFCCCAGMTSNWGERVYFGVQPLGEDTVMATGT